MSTAITYEEIVLDLNADVAEWCPTPSFTDLLAVGTYQLNEETQTRQGILYLYSLEQNESREIREDEKYSLKCMKKLPLPGIFDLSWQAWGTAPVLVAALADGSTRLLHPKKEDNSFDIVEVSSSGALENDMAVFVDQTERADDGIVSSYSSGIIRHHKVTSSGLTSLNSWQAHDLESWTACFNRWNSSIIYSGGDDCAFKAWDLRQDLEADSSAIWTNRKAHNAGVCCISCSPCNENIICTGSYDEYVRIWDCRMETKPVVTVDMSVGGGAWRLKWHPTKHNLILAACMHAGFAVLRYRNDSIEIKERYAHQQTLAYGAGWCHHGVDTSSSGIVATCSFYDRLLHLWSTSVI